jgi:uncharacterized protein YbaR (Trm112 family)/SAM-dependent methyltransferase
MKPYLLKFLVCPIDNQELTVTTFKQQENFLNDDNRSEIARRGLQYEDFRTELIHGLLINPRKKVIFPLYKGVPRLLVFEHPLLEAFRKEFEKECAPYFDDGYRFGNDKSIPGEQSVLASFSKEWTEYDYNPDAYWGQTAEVYNNSLFETLRNEKQDLSNKVVLELGIGSGGSAMEMSAKFGANLIGVDLGYSVEVAYKHFGASPFLHIVQASAFNLPFRQSTFDFVYSHGVIHHTFNTRRAFDKLSVLPRAGGRLYVWVYSHLNENRSMKRRLIMGLENLVRPWCSRLPGWTQTVVLIPIAPLYILHQNSQAEKKTGMARYNFREAFHAARDRFTPRYIHRHNEGEVMAWFDENGYEQIKPLSEKKFPDYVPVGFYMNTGVEGFRRK